MLAHYAVTRAHGRTVTGPPPATVIGQVVRSDLVSYFMGELDWAQQHGDQRYAVLNACRAVAYAETGVLISKIAGGRWWMQQYGHHRLVEACLTAQERGCDVGRCDEAARAFVAGCITQLQRWQFRCTCHDDATPEWSPSNIAQMYSSAISAISCGNE